MGAETRVGKIEQQAAELRCREMAIISNTGIFQDHIRCTEHGRLRASKRPLMPRQILSYLSGTSLKRYLSSHEA